MLMLLCNIEKVLLKTTMLVQVGLELITRNGRKLLETMIELK